MYIEPNTIIKIYKNVPLDTTYKNTLYFPNVSSQNAYFHGNSNIQKYTLTQQSYQRVERGRMRIEIKSDDLYDCNYLAFQNTSFDGKWFYAFILNVEYVNNVTSEVTFMIDVMQTYFLFDCEMLQSFVEREHTLIDEPGYNIVAENLELGEYTGNNGEWEGTGFFDTWGYCIASAYNPDGSVPDKPYVNCGIYTGLALFYTENINFISDYIDLLTSDNKQDGIVAIYPIPKSYVVNHISPWLNSGKYFIFDGEIDENYTEPKAKPTTIDNYIPRNKKLLTYPFTYELVTTFNGEGAEYHYEDFYGDEYRFITCGTYGTNPSFVLAPLRYKGILRNWNYSLTMNKIPLCGYQTDTYKAWVAQNKSANDIAFGTGSLSNFVSTIGGAIKGGISGSKGGTIGGAIGAIAGGIGGVLSEVNLIGSLLGQKTISEKMPNHVHGSSDGSMEIALGIKDFMSAQISIKQQNARIIDDYFDKYGYATHRIKIPNINGRTHWNYVKTVGFNVRGNCPQDDIAKICSIFDNGITFWNNPSEVGNYSLDNRV